MQENGYVHVKELDSSGYRSICPRCYRTVAKSTSESELAKADAGHVCLKAALQDAA